MANRTDPRARQIHGTNPQFLIDKITRVKIMNDDYTKQKLFALDAAGLVDRAFDMNYVGGMYGLGMTRPTKFLCLLLKMLQIQPSNQVVLEFIANKDFRYLCALGCLYFRMTCADAKTVYETLEPLLADFRRLALRDETGKFQVMHMDEFVDLLLCSDSFCGVTLPRIQKRLILEENGDLEPRKSALEDTGPNQDAAEKGVDYEYERASSHRSDVSMDSPSSGSGKHDFRHETHQKEQTV